VTRRKSEPAYRPRPRAARPDGRHEYEADRRPGHDDCALCGKPFESEVHVQLEDDVP
jgi:hypothetical protein